MKKIHALTALSIAIMASYSGVLQVQAVNYNFFEDFSTKEVSDFSAYRQTFNSSTYGLDNKIKITWVGSYSFDSCPTNFTANAIWRLFVRVNGLTPDVQLFEAQLPDFICTTTITPFISTFDVPLSPTYLDLFVNDDSDFIRFRSQMAVVKTAATENRVLRLHGYQNLFELTYDFNTTYLFNYFLSDQKFHNFSQSGSTFVRTGTTTTRLTYVFTTAGNDRYQINNLDTSSIGTNRKKYAVDSNAQFFRGESVGASFNFSLFGNDAFTLTGTTGGLFVQWEYDYFYLNVANLAQPIVNVPLINFTTQSCSGGFLDINVGCFVNNALAYLTNTAPIISDATQLINAGISFAGQTFGVIGAFTTNNMFGYLVLGGFGFIVIKSLFKNDK